MKRWAVLACWLLLLFATLFASLPLLLEQRPLQDHLVTYAEQSSGVKLQVGSIGWRWLPLPAITVRQLKAESASFTLKATAADLLLNPGVLFAALTGRADPGDSNHRTRPPLLAVRLIEPDFTLRRHERGGSFPLGHLGVVNGRVSLPAKALSPGLPAEAITLTEVNGSLSSSAHLLKIDMHGSSIFAHEFSLKGKLDLHRGDFQAEATAKGVDSAPLFGSSGTDAWLPVVKGGFLTAHLEGEAPDRFRLTLAAKRSPSTLELRGQTLQVAALTALTLTRAGETLTIDTDGLSLAAPRLSLSGQVARTLPADDPARGPEWSIDLQGKDLDLDAIRSHILSLFGQHPVAQKVCTIVGGGEAVTARYAFTGRVADFQHLHSMGIWAEARDVPITIPDLGLTLDRASGPIAIIEGQLSGQGLTATIGQSHGQNGDLRLDLEKERHGFTLALDLDVDLNDLQDVLSQIIPSARFQEELSRFVTIRGRAQGHLRLGDDLRQVKTQVEVEAMEARGVYDRLPWPFTISAGQLGVRPHHVDWQGVQGSLGKHRIFDTKGEVTWEGPIRLALQKLEADLDLNTLWQEGTLRTNHKTYAIRDLIRHRFATLAGRARLRRTTLAGPLLTPEEWRYHAEIKARDLAVTAAEVPELRSQEMEAVITQDHADFAGVFRLFEQELFLGGHYSHRLLQGWQGEGEINGDVGAGLGDWLKEKKLIPDLAFPRPPFRLEKFTVRNKGPEFASLLARGTIRALPLEKDATLHVTLSRDSGRTDDTITVVQGERQGTLRYQNGQERRLWQWQGELDFGTLALFFPQELLLAGTLNGTFSRLSDQGSTVYSGALAAEGVSFGSQGPVPGLTLTALRLQGDRESLLVQQADAELAGVPATLSGRITGQAGGHQLELRLTAPRLAWEPIRHLFDEYTKHGYHKKGETLRGSIGFDIGAFDYTRQPRWEQGEVEGGETEHTLTASPLRGVINLKAEGLAVQVDQWSLCGISGQGSWHFGEAKDENSIVFSSGQTPLSFAEALPCLGIKQSLIIGPFSVAGEIRGRPKKWRQGEITLTSKEGLIKRLTLLSKIFTAVNFTDLFTWQDLPDVEEEGLPYNDLALNGHIEENRLVLDRTIVKGKGVNLSGRGSIDLADLNADLTFFIAPFKMVDSVISNIPFIGKALAGPKESILTFPVTVTGNLKAPEVTALAPLAVGSATLEMFRDTLTLPFRILLPESKKADEKTPQTPTPPPTESEPFP